MQTKALIAARILLRLPRRSKAKRTSVLRQFRFARYSGMWSSFQYLRATETLSMTRNQGRLANCFGELAESHGLSSKNLVEPKLPLLTVTSDKGS